MPNPIGNKPHTPTTYAVEHKGLRDKARVSVVRDLNEQLVRYPPGSKAIFTSLHLANEITENLLGKSDIVEEAVQEFIKVGWKVSRSNESGPRRTFVFTIPKRKIPKRKTSAKKTARKKKA